MPRGKLQKKFPKLLNIWSVQLELQKEVELELEKWLNC